MKQFTDDNLIDLLEAHTKELSAALKWRDLYRARKAIVRIATLGKDVERRIQAALPHAGPPTTEN